MPGVVACLRALCVYVLMCFACLRAYMLFVLACVLVMMKCFIFLHVCVLGVLFYLICFTFQCLNLKILTEKNLCALLIWTYFLFAFWYQLIKLFEANLRVARMSKDISYSYSCFRAIWIITIFIFTYYINFCWTHCFCLIYFHSIYCCFYFPIP